MVTPCECGGERRRKMTGERPNQQKFPELVWQKSSSMSETNFFFSSNLFLRMSSRVPIKIYLMDVYSHIVCMSHFPRAISVKWWSRGQATVLSEWGGDRGSEIEEKSVTEPWGEGQKSPVRQKGIQCDWAEWTRGEQRWGWSRVTQDFISPGQGAQWTGYNPAVSLGFTTAIFFLITPITLQ